MNCRPLRELTLLVCLAAFCPSVRATESLRLLPITDEASFARVHDLFQIYRTSVQLISPDIVERLDIDSPDGLSRAADRISTEAAVAARLRLGADSVTSAACEDGRFEMLALPEVFRHKTRYDAPATTETLAHFFRINAKHYPADEWVSAHEILVKRDDWGAETSAAAARVARQLEAEPFARVAFLYNEGVGVKSDGWLGRVRRGQVPDWKFDLLMNSAPGRAFLGPVAVEEGWYFGKVDDRLTSNAVPFDYYRSRVEQDYRRIYAREKLRQVMSDCERAMQPEVRAFDVNDPAGPGQIAYSVAGTTLTFAECRKRLPFLLGDARSARFWDSICSQTLQNHLLLLRQDVQGLRNSPEFRYLADAYRNACLVERHIQQQLSRLSEDDAALRSLYKQRIGARGYLQPDMVRLLVARMEPTPGTPAHVDRELMARVRNQFEASPTTGTLERLQHTAPGIVYRVDNVPGPIDRLGRVLEMAIGDEGTGSLTPVFVGQDGAFYFVRVIARERGKPRPYEEVREQLKAELREERKAQILESLHLAGQNSSRPSRRSSDAGVAASVGFAHQHIQPGQRQ